LEKERKERKIEMDIMKEKYSNLIDHCNKLDLKLKRKTGELEMLTAKQT
jgi:hypothetical protein